MGRRDKDDTELVELTSKPLKLQMAVSGLLIFAGVIVSFASDDRMVSRIALTTAFVAFVWQTITRVSIWWNHG